MRGTPEKIKAYMQGYYQRNKEKIKERHHENYLKRKNKRRPKLPQTRSQLCLIFKEIEYVKDYELHDGSG